VTKLSSDGKAVLWTTLLGGFDRDEASAVTVDGFGNAYVVGVVCFDSIEKASQLRPILNAAKKSGAKRVEASLAPSGLIEARLCKKGETCFGWLLLDGKKKPKAIAGLGTRSPWFTLHRQDVKVEHATWAKPRFGAEKWLGIVPYESGESACEGESCGSDYERGYLLIWFDGNAVKGTRVTIWRQMA
jgi:hypothetical protein